MIKKYLLSLADKSPLAYSELMYYFKTRNGVVTLPSLGTLKDYRNYVRPTQGFSPEVIKDLSEKIKEFSEQERYISILLDEMRIQEDLVWEKNTG